METLHITYIQYHINWEQKHANFKKLEKLLEKETGTDLIVLPEMFATGFSMNASALAENEPGETFKLTLVDLMFVTRSISQSILL